MNVDYIKCGDCLSLMEELPNNQIDMILTDLPYGLTRNKWDSQIPLEDLWSAYWRVLKPAGIIALTASQPFSSTLVSSQLIYFRHEWIWIKNRGSNFANTVREPMKEHESILIFSRGKWTYNRQMQPRTGGGASRVKYDFNKVTDTENYGRFASAPKPQGELRVPSSWQKFNCEVGLHPTQKPVLLLEYLIKTYTNPGEVVLDSCMGSGSTCVAAINTHRHYIGYELNEGYFQTAKERLNRQQTGSVWNPDNCEGYPDVPLKGLGVRVRVGDQL